MRKKELALLKIKSRIAAATALGLLMADAAAVAYAAPAGVDRTSVDPIKTGPVPGFVQLAQNEGTPGAGLPPDPRLNIPAQPPAAEEGEARKPRNDRRAQQPAQPAEEQPAPRATRRAQQPADADQARPPQAAEEAPQPRNNRRAQQPAADEARPPQAAEEAPQPRNNRRAQQPQAEEQPAPRANPRAQKPDAAAQDRPAVKEGDGQLSREERLRQRREALRKKQQDGETADQPAAAEPPRQAEPAAPAKPPEPRPPRQAQPAQPATPPAAGQDAGQTEQARPNETEREKRLRERREALRQLQGGANETVEGAQPPPPGSPELPAQAGQPGMLEGAPANAAPVLDSQKPRRGPGNRGNEGRGNGGRDIGQGNGTAAPPVAAVPVAPPSSDQDAQANAPRMNEIPSVRDEQGRRVEGQPRRYERPEGADVLKEIGSRVILGLGDQMLIRNNDRGRFTRDARDVYYEELPRGRTRETIVRPNGVTIVTVRDRYGEVIRRSRILPDGQEYVLVYADEDRLERSRRDGWRDPGEDLPPLVISMPYEEYIFDAERVDYNDDEAYYEFLEQPPVEKVQRLYSVDEVKQSARVRDSVRRIDLDTITFETGSAMIADAQVEKLDGVANAMLRLLEKNPAETFLIEGHTDAIGSDLSNLALSDERAEAVASALTEVFEIPAENLTTQGYGEQYLKIDSQAAERENRRVAIRRITPLVAPVASAN